MKQMSIKEKVEITKFQNNTGIIETTGFLGGLGRELEKKKKNRRQRINIYLCPKGLTC